MNSSIDKYSFELGRKIAIQEFVEFLEDKFIMLNTPEFDGNDAGMVRDDIKQKLAELKQELKSEVGNGN